MPDSREETDEQKEVVEVKQAPELANSSEQLTDFHLLEGLWPWACP